MELDAAAVNTYLEDFDVVDCNGPEGRFYSKEFDYKLLHQLHRQLLYKFKVLSCQYINRIA